MFSRGGNCIAISKRYDVQILYSVCWPDLTWPDLTLWSVCFFFSQDGWTPLMTAAARNNTEMVRLHLNAGANTEAADEVITHRPNLILNGSLLYSYLPVNWYLCVNTIYHLLTWPDLTFTWPVVRMESPLWCLQFPKIILTWLDSCWILGPTTRQQQQRR